MKMLKNFVKSSIELVATSFKLNPAQTVLVGVVTVLFVLSLVGII